MGSGDADCPVKHSLGQEGVCGWQRKIRRFPGRRRHALRDARMGGLSCVYRTLKGIAKEVNGRTCAGPAESCSLPALCSIFLLFHLQLICKTCQVFISRLFGVFFVPLHSGTGQAAV